MATTLKTWVGKACTCTWKGKPGRPIAIIDWKRYGDRAELLQDVFGDCEVPGDFPGLLALEEDEIVWASKKLIPFGLVGQQAGGAGQLEAIALIDTSNPAGAVYAIEVDGTAIPARAPAKVASSLDALKLVAAAPARPGKSSGPSFDELRPLLKSGKMNSDGLKVLAALSGDKDYGTSYLSRGKKLKAPSGHDPRWMEALGEELTSSIRFSSVRLNTETMALAGTLACFGPEAIPVLIGAFDRALAKYGVAALGVGATPILSACASLKSDAAVPVALAIVTRAPKPEKSFAIGPALAYLLERKDPRIAPAVKKLLSNPKVAKAVQYEDELGAIAKKLKLSR